MRLETLWQEGLSCAGIAAPLARPWAMLLLTAGVWLLAFAVVVGVVAGVPV